MYIPIQIEPGFDKHYSAPEYISSSISTNN